MMPATVKTPPTMAQTLVRKCAKDLCLSVNLTIMGDKSYIKNTPNKPVNLMHKNKWNLPGRPWPVSPLLAKIR